MRALADIALIGWLPLALVLFATVRSRTAILCVLLGGTMFLPIYEIKLPGIPDYDKSTAIGVALILGIALFHLKTFLDNFKIRAYDIPIIVWCTGAFFTSISNGIGVYDGVSVTFGLTMTWAVPYFVGRTFFNDHQGIKTLATGIVVAGLVYLPFCLWEIKMSPRLHNIVYGFRQHSFAQTRRGEGWRPMVFMQHGLAVAMFMSCAATIAVWVWLKRTVKQIYGITMPYVAIPLVVVTVGCRSLGAIGLMVMGLTSLALASKTRSSLWVVAFICLPLLYMGVRATGQFGGDVLVDMAGTISDRAAQSLGTRIFSENVLIDHAFERPVFGWGGYGRSGIKDEKGKRIVRTEEGEKVKVIQDGMWIIALGQRGLVGLTAITFVFILPSWLLIRKYKRELWTSPYLAPASVLMVMLAMYMFDNLLNAMMNPMFTLAAGALIGYLDNVQKDTGSYYRIIQTQTVQVKSK